MRSHRVPPRVGWARLARPRSGRAGPGSALLAGAVWAGLLLSAPGRLGAWPAVRQVTRDPVDHVLDNNDNFSADDRWLVYDTREREDAIGANAAIGRVEVATGVCVTVYREADAHPWGPGVGAASFNPVDGSVDFIRGLSSATAARPYSIWRRTGVRVPWGRPDALGFLDARDVTAPFTPGALRGGTHRHEWSADGQWIGFTYNDALLAEIEQRTGRKVNLRTVGVATRLGGPVQVHHGPENQDGEWFAAVVARVSPEPRPGSDEISQAFEDAWVGSEGYRRPDGTWQRRARAFLGTVRGRDGRDFTEVYVVDLPDRIDVPGDGGPLEGTPGTMPNPPRGTTQRRLTFTEDWPDRGVALAPRHWVRSSPDGTRIVFLARDAAGIVQADFVSPNGGPIVPVTHGAAGVESCVRWSPDGSRLLYVSGHAIRVCEARPGSPGFGDAHPLTPPMDPAPTSPVWSHDGRTIAFNRRMAEGGDARQQIFVVAVPSADQPAP